MGPLRNEKLHTASVWVKNNYCQNTRSRKHKNQCNNHQILDSSVFAYLNTNVFFFWDQAVYIWMSLHFQNVRVCKQCVFKILKFLNMTLWLALKHYSFSLFIHQDCGSAETEFGITQTIVSITSFIQRVLVLVLETNLWKLLVWKFCSIP